MTPARLSIISAGLLACAMPGAPLLAAGADKPATEAPAVFRSVTDCRTVSDPAERLACYDRTVGALETARANKDVVIIDRQTMRETRQGLFGISIPKLKLFGGDDEDEAEMVREITSTIKAIGTASDGLPIYLLAEGGKWKQTDGRNVFPRVGQSITIKLGTLNKYTASINDRAGVRVIRLMN